MLMSVGVALFLSASALFGMGANSAVVSKVACTGVNEYSGGCPPKSASEIANGGVDVVATDDKTTGGGDTDSELEGDSVDDDDVSVDGGGAGAGVAPWLTIVRDGFTVNCEPGSPCDPNLVVRVSEIVNFRSALPSLGMEPSGWAVIGLPVNFFATASVNVQSGTLLGYPAEVRFSPVGYRWDYGDGQSARSSDGGSSWAAQGLPEFSATATSHVYESRGAMLVTLSVEYSAEYRFAGGPWIAVTGAVSGTTPPQRMLVVVERTALTTLG